jgi:hypothetical protein
MTNHEIPMTKQRQQTSVEDRQATAAWIHDGRAALIAGAGVGYSSFGHSSLIRHSTFVNRVFVPESAAQRGAH